MENSIIMILLLISVLSILFYIFLNMLHNAIQSVRDETRWLRDNDDSRSRAIHSIRGLAHDNSAKIGQIDEYLKSYEKEESE